MFKARNFVPLLALCSVAALPACSMFGGGNNGAAQTSRATYVAPPAVSRDLTQQVQTRLQQDGSYTGQVDGVWGPATEAAVRSYQQKHNLTATGQLDSNTLASLNLGTGSQTSANSPPANSQPYAAPPPANTNTNMNTAPVNPPPTSDPSAPNTNPAR
jgi:peptidoglycan hydrolase-like protein with peptidoglycan-binding domain